MTATGTYSGGSVSFFVIIMRNLVTRADTYQRLSNVPGKPIMEDDLSPADM